MVNREERITESERRCAEKGGVYVRSHKKSDGTFVRGFCREISKKQRPVYQVVDTSPNSLIVAYKGEGYIYDKKNHQWYYASGGKMDRPPFKEKDMKIQTVKRGEK